MEGEKEERKKEKRKKKEDSSLSGQEPPVTETLPPIDTEKVKFILQNELRSLRNDPTSRSADKLDKEEVQVESEGGRRNPRRGWTEAASTHRVRGDGGAR